MKQELECQRFPKTPLLEKSDNFLSRGVRDLIFLNKNSVLNVLAGELPACPGKTFCLEKNDLKLIETQITDYVTWITCRKLYFLTQNNENRLKRHILPML